MAYSNCGINVPDSYCKEPLPFQQIYYVQLQPPENPNKSIRVENNNNNNNNSNG